MTEREKMLAGLPYDSRDAELLEMYHTARATMQAYNQHDSRDLEGRQALLEQMLGKVATGVWIENPFFCDYGKHIEIGANTFVNTNCIFLDDNFIRIGSDCLIGPYTQIYTAGHPLRAEERIRSNPSEGGSYVTNTQPVTIGNKVWIGGNVVILPGVTIGNGVTIAASALVKEDVPNNSLVVGNPGRVVKQL
ncbi:MAG: sugar O-acetyltransferase [Cytophagales bacterium]|nr:sugar O-acetyltransferase [Cytophagales bacterium]